MTHHQERHWDHQADVFIAQLQASNERLVSIVEKATAAKVDLRNEVLSVKELVLEIKRKIERPAINWIAAVQTILILCLLVYVTVFDTGCIKFGSFEYRCVGHEMVE